MQSIGPSATKYVATVGMPSVWQVQITQQAIHPRLVKTLSKGRVASSLPTKPDTLPFLAFPSSFCGHPNDYPHLLH
jgi:hypothetical protein